MLFNNLTNDQIRNVCREKLESLEYWLRRLIDETLKPIYGQDYINYRDSHGNYVLKRETREKIQQRTNEEPTRYPRLIDATLLDHCVDIICLDKLYNHFRPMLLEAFPEGREEARTFFKRLIYPRNCLSHANPISIRQAEQVICYTNDIIESIKNYYISQNMHNEYNVPLILKFTDSFGNEIHRSPQYNVHDGGQMYRFEQDPKCFLRPGDVLIIEVEIDPGFDESEYTIRWASSKGFSGDVPNGKRAVINITNQQVAALFSVHCNIITNKDWHRMHNGLDDLMMVYYKVLPPH